MNVLVYPSTHSHASSVQQLLSSILVPHYLPQVISPDVLAARENPWQTACGLLVLLAAPDHHAGVRQYAETGGKILALGVNASRSQGIFGLHEATSGSAGAGLELIKDTSVLRLVDGKASLHLSFPPRAPIPATVNHDEKEFAITRIPGASLDLGGGVRVLGCYPNDGTHAGALSKSGAIALWSCAPPLPEQLLITTLSALALRFDSSESPEGKRLGPSLLPQLLLAHPKRWDIRRHIMRTLFPDRDLETAFSSLTLGGDTHTVPTNESAVFSDDQDTFRFHFTSNIATSDLPSNQHPILSLLSGPPEEGVKDAIVTAQPLTAQQEKYYTPLFSPSRFFVALDEFRPARKADELLIGDVLLYGEVVTSTQTMLDRNPRLLHALPSPLVSLATKQLAGRGRGKNTWLSPAGSMLVSLRLNIPLKSAGSSHDSCSIRPSNLVFIQYLFALAVVEACQALDPAKKWATKVRLKWPNDIYGEFPAETGSKVELRKMGGIIVNTSFRGNTVNVIIGTGLNILNEPPVGSLAQLEALTRGQGVASSLSVERVTAAILTSFERMWDLFLAEESEGFRPFMGRYTNSWLHSDQTVTLTTTIPHTTVRIVGITPDHGLLRTEPLGGGQYIDLQPDGNSFDMLKGLIKTKTS